MATMGNVGTSALEGATSGASYKLAMQQLKQQAELFEYTKQNTTADTAKKAAEAATAQELGKMYDSQANLNLQAKVFNDANQPVDLRRKVSEAYLSELSQSEARLKARLANYGTGGFNAIEDLGGLSIDSAKAAARDATDLYHRGRGALTRGLGNITSNAKQLSDALLPIMRMRVSP